MRARELKVTMQRNDDEIAQLEDEIEQQRQEFEEETRKLTLQKDQVE